MNSKQEVDTTYDVFISYRRSDGSCRAKLLEKYLTDMGYSVFLDLNLRESGRLPEILRNAIKSSKNFILLVTPGVFDKRIHEKEDWVAGEIATALNSHNRKRIEILPLSMGGDIIIPKKEELPQGIWGIETFHVFDVNLIDEDQECRRRLKSFSANLVNTVVSGKYSKIGSADPDEYKRLMVQIENSAGFDKEHIDYVLKKLKAGRKEISILDVGCERGYGGKLLFDDDSIKKVLGIDKDEKCILDAKLEQKENGKFVYETIDLESINFNAEIDNIMNKHNLKKFDLVYASMVLHHLKNPLKTLKNLYKKLDNGGYIIVKGSDDRSKIISKDGSESLEEHQELLEKIIKLTMTIPEMSDREFGRKIYGLLNRSGFKDIEIFSNVRETSRMDLEMKERLFRETFEWRIRACYTINKNGLKVPISGELERNMKSLINQFEDVFTSDDFWYCDHDYVGIARK